MKNLTQADSTFRPLNQINWNQNYATANRPARLSWNVSVCLSVCPLCVCLTACLFGCLSVFLTACLTACPFLRCSRVAVKSDEMRSDVFVSNLHIILAVDWSWHNLWNEIAARNIQWNSIHLILYSWFPYSSDTIKLFIVGNICPPYLNQNLFHFTVRNIPLHILRF